jgi:hypothetical protein
MRYFPLFFLSLFLFIGCGDSSVTGPTADSTATLSFTVKNSSQFQSPGDPDEITISAWRPDQNESAGNPAKARSVAFPPQGGTRRVVITVPIDEQANGDDYTVGIIAYGTDGATEGAISFGAEFDGTKKVFPGQVTVFDLRGEQVSLANRRLEWKIRSDGSDKAGPNGEKKSRCWTRSEFVGEFENYKDDVPESANVVMNVDEIRVQFNQNISSKTLNFLGADKVKDLNVDVVRDLLQGPNDVADMPAVGSSRKFKTNKGNNNLNDWTIAALRTTSATDGYFPIQLRVEVAQKWIGAVAAAPNSSIDPNDLNVTLRNPSPTKVTTTIDGSPADEVKSTYAVYCDLSGNNESTNPSNGKFDIRLLENGKGLFANQPGPFVSTNPF